jgi:hypothetical protein
MRNELRRLTVLRDALCICIAFSAAFACRKPGPPPTIAVQQMQPQATQSNSDPVEEESCRVFVQKFYDWYWNRFTNDAGNLAVDGSQIPMWDDVLRLKPNLFEPDLLDLLKQKRVEMERTGEIGNLDFDPFTNGRATRGKYIVSNVSLANGNCDAKIPKGQLIAVAKREGKSWLFTNFKYSYISGDGEKLFPDADLVSGLRH